MVQKIQDFAKLRDGRLVDKYILENTVGTKVEILSLGAVIQKLFVKNKEGEMLDVVLGYDKVDDYLNSDYQGAVVGPYANRIKDGSFTISGETFNVTKNEDGKNSLHSARSFTDVVWEGEIISNSTVKLNHFTKNLTEGFPGNMKVSVFYTLNDDNSLEMKITAVSDSPAVINPSNHSYFNLSGFDSGDILDTVLKLNASRYTPVDSEKIPTGESANVKGTPFTFLEPKTIGERINFDHEQLKNTNGYDHNYCIEGFDGSLRTAAIAHDKKSGITLEVQTTLPGIQFYSGNFLNGQIGKNNTPMNFRNAFCLETQFYPDTPNNPLFPQCTFKANEEYKSSTIYKFSVG